MPGKKGENMPSQQNSALEKIRAGFLSPANEFSPLPFWFWNDELTEAELLRQIEDFEKHGVMGFVIHPRKGLPGTIPYLSDRFMHFVRFAVEEAAKRQMRVVLYDEAMYPSGSAHGMVVKENPAWASRCLEMQMAEGNVEKTGNLIFVCAARVENGKAADIEAAKEKDGVYLLPDDGRVLLCFRVGFSGGTIRGIHEEEDDGERFAPASADLLNPQAVQCFIRLTHERYAKYLSDHFGKTVIAMFTDEPMIMGRGGKKGCQAWTDDFLPAFGDPLDLPGLFLDVGEETENIRLRYRRAINTRMLESYYGPLADWCENHGLALAGHPDKSWNIGLLRPFQLPGQDVVWRHIGPGKCLDEADSVLGKCSADAARHSGRRRNANECFGCCGPDDIQWAFTADDMKWYMDYLFVRGVNLLYPHAFFYSLREDRKDERPPDVGPNNLWWPWYDEIARYMKRMCYLMTDSVNQARVAVLCEEDGMPFRECKALYENQIEFNYLELSRLPECALKDGALCIEKQRYTHLLTGKPDLSALPRDAVVFPAAPDLRFSHVVKDGLHFYVLVNEGEKEIAASLSVAAQGRAEWWNAWTGEMKRACPDEKGAYALDLPRRESIILCIDPSAPAHAAEEKAENMPLAFSPLAGYAWQVTRLSDGQSLILTADEKGRLPGWETIPGWEDYSGWVAYEAEISLAGSARLDLGECHALARLFCDGKETAHKMWGPYHFDIPAGTKKIRIEIGNTPANQMEQKYLPSGLMGPVGWHK